MTDLTPNDLSHLSNEEFNALCPQGYHAPGSAEPSPAAQAVLNPDDQIDKEWQELLSQCLSAQSIAENEGFEFPYYLDDKAQELKVRWCAAALRAAGLYLQNAYANEEPMDHADDFLLDLANELEALPND